MHLSVCPLIRAFFHKLLPFSMKVQLEHLKCWRNSKTSCVIMFNSFSVVLILSTLIQFQKCFVINALHFPMKKNHNGP